MIDPISTQVGSVTFWTNVWIAAAATASAFFAFLAWLAYQKMNEILGATNKISERMVEITRMARFQSTAPILYVWLETGDEDHPDPIVFPFSDTDTGALTWAVYSLAIRNRGPGRALDIECDPPWEKLPGPIEALAPGQLAARQTIHVPRTEGADWTEIRLVLKYRDEQACEWEAVVQGGACSCRMVRDVVAEATRTAAD